MDPHGGGVQMSTFKLGRHFNSLGDEVAVFSFAREGHASCKFGTLYYPAGPGAGDGIWNLDFLESVLREFRPDIVINQMPYEHIIGKVLRKNKKYLLLGCLRNTLFSVKGNLKSYVERTAPFFINSLSDNQIVQKAFLALHRRRHARDLARILEIYDYFVMFGPPNLDELEYFLPGFDPRKVRLIPNSIPRVAESLPFKEKRLLWLGRVAHEQKQAGLILEIWERVFRDLSDWHLDVVGAGPALGELQQQVSDAKLPRIEFHGRRAPDEYYRRSAIFFMTSAFEGFPNTLVEAQSYGAIPVIFDSYPVASWIVENGESGFLVEPFDVDAMAKQVIAVSKDADRGRIAERALQSARRFQIDRVAQIWQELFEAEVPKHVAQPEPEPAT